MHMNICVHVYISIHLCVPSCAGIQGCLCGLTLVCAMVRDSACVLCCPRPMTTCVSMVWGWQGRGSVGGGGTSPYVSVLLYVLISGYTFSRYHLKLRHFSFWRRAIRSDTSPKSTPGFCKVGSQAGGALEHTRSPDPGLPVEQTRPLALSLSGGDHPARSGAASPACLLCSQSC